MRRAPETGERGEESAHRTTRRGERPENGAHTLNCFSLFTSRSLGRYSFIISTKEDTLDTLDSDLYMVLATQEDYI